MGTEHVTEGPVTPTLKRKQSEPSRSTADAAREFFEFCAKLMETKDAAYGGAWQAQGWMGNLARIQSKTARLRNMLWRDETEPPVIQGSEHSMQSDADQETIYDTLMDLANLSFFMAENMREGNKWGR